MCRQRAYEDRSRRADTLRIVKLEAQVKRLREELTQLRAADPSGSDRASERAERPALTAGLRRPGREGGPQQTWLLLQGEEDERVALIGEYPTQAQATRARSQYWKRNPGSPEPVFIRSRSKVSRKMLLNPPENWPRE